MFVLIWATLLFSVRHSSADTGSFPGGKKHCEAKSYCVTLSEAEIAAEAGLCVVIPCSFTTGFKPKNIIWYKCEQSKTKCEDTDIIFHSKTNREVQSGFKGRVSLLEPDVTQGNCSIIVNDLTESDSGSYQLRVKSSLNGKEDGFTFTNKATVSVKGLTQKPTVMIPPLTEGQQTTLTCTAPGLCSGSDPEITWTWRGAGETDSHITGNITAFKTENLTAVSQRHSSSLTFNPSAVHHGTNVTCKVSFANSISTEETVTLNVSLKGNTATEEMTTPTVTNVTKPVISGNTTVKEGDALNLTCSISSHPSALTWTKHGSNESLEKETTVALQNKTGTATLVIRNVTAEYSGLYICTARHQTSLTTHAEVNVIFPPMILSSSGCVVQSEVLTCVCISEGFPLPTIKWPLLKNHTEYSVTTTVSNHTVNSTATVTVKDHSTSVECVSSNTNGEARENLTVQNDMSNQEGQTSEVLKIVSRPEVIIAFVIGVVLSAVLCCLAKKCHRKKQKSSGNLDDTLEVVTSQEYPLIDASQAVEDDQTYNQEAAEEGGAVAAEKATSDLNGGPKDVEYASIDFSVLKRRLLREAAKKQETKETEYAEIKKAVKKETEENGGENGDVLEGKEEQAMIEEDEENKQYVSEKEEEEEMAVYSSVKDVVDEM